MPQTRLESLIEAAVGTTVAFLITLAVSLPIYRLFGIEMSLQANVGLTLVFTIISLIRSYFVRRFFATHYHRLASWLASLVTPRPHPAPTAKVVLASRNCETGTILWTLHLTYWRAIHAEFMTHRVFSRNAGSSRAKPVAKVLAQVWNDPAGPMHWGRNQSGMQANTELSGLGLWAAQVLWRFAGRVACVFAWAAMKLGLHKQVANRLLEPWQQIDVLVTATDWENFFALRNHKDAQPEIQALAIAILLAMDDHIKARLVQDLWPGQWHLPYITAEEAATYDNKTLLRLSTARSARISYAPFDGNASVAKEVERHDSLVMSQPIHASPTEHQALASKGPMRNLRDWEQYRVFVEAGLVGWV